jgi:threonine/homoserine/homoserine lactone efflux protein
MHPSVSGALLAGIAIGFLGAIPPGPSSMAVAAHAADGRSRRAVAVGLGAASVDATLCAAIALGAGPWLARLTEPPAVRVFLAVAYAVLGALLVVEAILRPKRARAPRASVAQRIDGFASGVLRGVTNPTLVANWTMVIAALSSTRVLPPGPSAGALFAAGVGLGVAAWFAILARVVGSAPQDRLAPWLRGAGILTGALLVAGGGLGCFRALVG